MYFPWPGLLEQIRLSDVFIYYDDVQYARGFFNRVQIKTPSGIRWLTVPLRNQRRGQLINEVQIDNAQDWKTSHLTQLRQAYSKAPYCKEIYHLVDEVFAQKHSNIGELAQASTDAFMRYFPVLADKLKIEKSSSMNVSGASTQRLVDLCNAEKAEVYLTGHGARHYLDHERFEALGIDVAYIDYSLTEYPQQHGAFTPYVSTLDLIANCGPAGVECIRGQMIPWRNFVEPAAHPENPS
jgi:hypothetical protein